MCEYCEGTERISATEADAAIDDVTLDVDGLEKMLDLIYEINYAEWYASFAIKYCPMCGVKLEGREER